jgi:hypothetical protein
MNWEQNEAEWGALNDPACDNWREFKFRCADTARTAEAWQRRRQRLGLTGTVNPGQIPDATAPVLRNPMNITLRDGEPGIVVFSDIHAPRHKADFIEKVMELTKVWGIRRGVLGGDFMDLASLSSHDPYIPDSYTSLVGELDTSKALLDWFLEYLDDVYWFLGNHERRLVRWTAGRMGMQVLRRIMSDKVKWSDWLWVSIMAGRDEYRVVHPQTARKVPLSMARELATTYNCNILMAHGHLVGSTYSQGGYLCMDIGGGMDTERFDYTQMNMGIYPQSKNGAVILRLASDGTYKPYLIEPDSDFEALGKMY